MKNCDILAGVHGAGFANLVFCRPGTRVVEIGWNKKGEIEGRKKRETKK